MSDDEIAGHLRVLEEIALAIEGEFEEGFEAPGLLKNLVAGGLSRTASLCRSIVTLGRQGKFVDADVLVRSVVDLSITLLWTGGSEDRARRIRSEGMAKKRAWLEDMRPHYLTDSDPAGLQAIDAALAALVKEAENNPPGPQAPPMRNRADEGPPPLGSDKNGVSVAHPLAAFGKEVYAFAFRRSSSATHNEYGVLLSALRPNDDERDAAEPSLYDACACAILVVGMGADVLKLSRLEPLVQNIVDRIRPKPSTVGL